MVYLRNWGTLYNEPTFEMCFLHMKLFMTQRKCYVFSVITCGYRYTLWQCPQCVEPGQVAMATMSLASVILKTPCT